MAIKVHFMILVAGLVMAASISSLVEAGRPDPALESSVASVEPVGEAKSSSFSVELVLRNMAQGSVTFQLGSQVGSGNGVVGEEVEVQTGQRAAMGPVEVSVEKPVVRVDVTVKPQSRSAAVKKVLHIDLAKHDFGDGEVKEGSRRSVVVTAMESWRLKSGKYLVIQVGTQQKMALSFKLYGQHDHR